MSMKQISGRDAVLAYLRRGWVLQVCSGSRVGMGWCWVRKDPTSPEVVPVHAATARSLIRSGLLVAVPQPKYKAPTYRLPAPERRTAGEGTA